MVGRFEANRVHLMTYKSESGGAGSLLTQSKLQICSYVRLTFAREPHFVSELWNVSLMTPTLLELKLYFGENNHISLCLFFFLFKASFPLLSLSACLLFFSPPVACALLHTSG